jgi:hypothetical protein
MPQQNQNWPISKLAYGSYGWLMQETGRSLGLNPDMKTWNHSDRARVDSIVQSGLMQFYFPPPLEDTRKEERETDTASVESQKDARTRQPYVWSWLKQLSMVETVSGQSVYELPEEFAGPSGDLVIMTGEGRLPVVAEEHLRALLAKN